MDTVHFKYIYFKMGELLNFITVSCLNRDHSFQDDKTPATVEKLEQHFLPEDDATMHHRGEN